MKKIKVANPVVELDGDDPDYLEIYQGQIDTPLP
jgi:hypothetical protein